MVVKRTAQGPCTTVITLRYGTGGTEKYFRKNFQQQFPGSIVEAQVGFMGPPNAKDNPTYSEVCSGDTGHVEVWKIMHNFSPCIRS
jgi:peptide methionine sulfoxide reductase MsrA